MATTVYTEPELYQLIIAYLSGLYPGKRTGPRSFLGDQARAVAQVVSLIQVKIQQADKDAVPVTEIINGVLKSRCSREALDNWAFLFALPSNKGASIYGRNGAQVAYGGAGLAVGTAGTIVPTGALLTDPSGLVQVELTDTLREALDWSHVLLGDTEQRVLRRLAICSALLHQPKKSVFREIRLQVEDPLANLLHDLLAHSQSRFEVAGRRFEWQ